MDHQQDDFWSKSFDSPRAAKTGCAVLIMLVVVGFLMLLSQCGGTAHPPTDNSLSDASTPIDQTSEFNQAVSTKVDAEQNLRAMLKDADSAEFRNEFVSRLKGGNMMLCGEVNSKNSFGGFGGYSRFIASPNPAAPNIIEGESLGSDRQGMRSFEQAWLAACSNLVHKFD